MRRRLDVALGLVHRPEVLFLDEPTTGLDPEARTAMWDEIGRLAGEEGLTILLTTHYLEEADRLAGAVAIVDRGRVVVAGTPSELKANCAATPCTWSCGRGPRQRPTSRPRCAAARRARGARRRARAQRPCRRRGRAPYPRCSPRWSAPGSPSRPHGRPPLAGRRLSALRRPLVRAADGCRRARRTSTIEGDANDRAIGHLALTIRDLLRLGRQPWFIAIVLVQPVIWLLLFGALFERVVDIPGFAGGDYKQYLVPGVLVMTAFFSSGWNGMPRSRTSTAASSTGCS